MGQGDTGAEDFCGGGCNGDVMSVIAPVLRRCVILSL